MDGVDPLRAIINISIYGFSPAAISYEMTRQVVSSSENALIRIATKTRNLDKGPYGDAVGPVKAIGWLVTNALAIGLAQVASNRVTGETLSFQTVMLMEGIGLVTTNFLMPILCNWDRVEFVSPVKIKPDY